LYTQVRFKTRRREPSRRVYKGGIMTPVSQEEINKLLSAGPKAAAPGRKEPPDSPLSRWRTRNFPQDNSCAITQEELNRVLGTRNQGL
jgi:hypothetical protein